MTDFSFKLLTVKDMATYLLRFYAVGFLLFALPFTREAFLAIIPLSLWLVIGGVFYFHRHWDAKTIYYFIFVILSAFFLEMAGTVTGQIFGVYRYDSGLGFQINRTPVIIGVNWLFLVYASRDIAYRLFDTPLGRVLTGSLMMIVYDLVLEWVAPVMQMWHFDTAYPPFRNFVAWFFMALFFHSGFEILSIPTRNKPASLLFSVQLLFFLLIGLYSSLFIR